MQPDRAKLEDLLRRVEGATGPDREIDAAIAHALGFEMWSVCLGDWLYGKPWREHMHPDERGSDTDEQLDAPFRWFVRIEQAGLLVGEDLPLFTASVDAALALIGKVLPGWTIARISQGDEKLWSVELREGYLTSYSRVVIAPAHYRAPTPALALCAALLSALIANAAAGGGDG